MLFRGADYNTDHYLTVEEVKERLLIGNNSVQRDVISRNVVEVNEKYQFNISKDLQHWKSYIILWI
jgi:hypothetical protein